MNNHPSKSIGIHQELGLQTKFRKKRASILKIYTVDVFPKSQPVHHQASPPIVVLQGSVPMATTIHPINPTTVLSEPFVDLIDEIEQATNLSEERRRHWVCSLRQIAKSLDRPAEVIPARWSAIRIAVGQLHHARVGVTAKTLANHKSNVKAALRFYQKARATPAWCTIDPRLGQVSWGPGFHVLERVSSLVRRWAYAGILTSILPVLRKSTAHSKASASRRAVRRRSRPVEPLLFSPRHRTRFGEQQHL